MSSSCPSADEIAARLAAGERSCTGIRIGETPRIGPQSTSAVGLPGEVAAAFGEGRRHNRPALDRGRRRRASSRTSVVPAAAVRAAARPGADIVDAELRSRHTEAPLADVDASAGKRDQETDSEKPFSATSLSGEEESVTTTMKEYVPLFVGVPLSTPVDERLIPGGSPDVPLAAQDHV